MSDTTYTQADMDKAVADANAALEKKRDELLDEVRALKAEVRKSKEIDPADLAKLEEENAKLKADLAKVAKDAKAATERAEKAEKAFADESALSARTMTENALNEALAGAGVTNPAFLKAAKAMMAGSAQVVAEGEARSVKIGDKALADYVKEWAATEEAKHFITAPDNHGGGATGGNRGGGSNVVDRETFAKMTPAAQSDHIAKYGREGIVDKAA